MSNEQMNQPEEKSWDRPQWYDLSDLIRFFPAAKLADWIEQSFVMGVDRFGRYKRLETDDLKKPALDALAYLYKAKNGGADDLDFMDVGYGWFVEDMPGGEEVQEIVSKSKSSEARLENNYKRLIGALLEFMSGEVTGQAHPQWTHGPTKEEREAIEDLGEKVDSYADNHLPLRQWLECKYKKRAGVQGFDMATLDQKFTEAINLLNSGK
jgi:hypothetical protein